MAKIQFRPSKWLTFVTIVLLSLFVALGNWQLERADQKQHLLSISEINSKLPATIIDSQFQPDITTDYMYRKIQVSGTYLSNFIIALDNQHEQGKVGFHIYTPFKIENSNTVILVNRGWVELQNNQRKIPVIETASEQMTLLGMAYVPSNPVIKLGNADVKIKERDIVQYIDLVKLSNGLGIKLLPFVLLLDGTEPSGFVRNWKVVSAPPEKSTSYAMQWYSFAILLVVLFVSLNVKRVK